MNKEIEIMQEGNNIMRLLKGSLFAFVTTLVLLCIYSFILTFTNVSEKTMATCTIIITCMSILIGSSASMVKIKKAGIINGGLIGLIYMIVIYLFSSVLQTGFNLNVNSMIIIVCGILAGMVRRNYRS